MPKHRALWFQFDLGVLYWLHGRTLHPPESVFDPAKDLDRIKGRAGGEGEWWTTWKPCFQPYLLLTVTLCYRWPREQSVRKSCIGSKQTSSENNHVTTFADLGLSDDILK